MGNLFKSPRTEVKKTTDTTQTQAIGGGAQPLLSQSLRGVGSALNAPGVSIGDFPGLNTVQNEALGGIANQARQGTGLIPAAMGTSISNLGFQNPFEQPIGQFGEAAAQFGLTGLAGTAAGGVGPNAALQGQLDALREQQLGDFAPALGRFSAGISQQAGDIGNRGVNPNGIVSQAGGKFVEDAFRGFGQANAGVLATDARDRENRALAAQQSLLSGGIQGLLGGANVAQGGAETQLRALGLAPQTGQFGFSDLDRLLGSGNVQRDAALQGFNVQNQLGQQNFQNQVQAGQLSQGVGQAFGDQTGQTVNTQDRFGKSLFNQIAGPLSIVAGGALGGPMGASLGGQLFGGGEAQAGRNAMSGLL